VVVICQVLIYGGTIAGKEDSVTAPFFEVFDPDFPDKPLVQFPIDPIWKASTVMSFYP
jgi:hypothetical protein